MMSELVGELGDPLSMLGLDRVDGARVERAPTVGQQARVRDFLGEGLLEAIERLAAGAPPVELFQTLEFAKVLPEGRGWRYDGLKQGHRNVAPQHRCRLQQALGLLGKEIDASKEDGFDRLWHYRGPRHGG